jgi:hypothetical protein
MAEAKVSGSSTLIKNANIYDCVLFSGTYKVMGK